MNKIRTGLGYDIHAFADGRKLMLGGVEVEYERGLDGHSDADVLLHAVADAILGALGKGDIGEHFPNNDPAYKDISSLKLLEKVYEILSQEKYQVGNVDIMLLAEEPNIKKYKPQMRTKIAACLKIDEGDVNIKATTHERLGAIGQKQGIAAMASVLVFKESRKS